MKSKFFQYILGGKSESISETEPCIETSDNTLRMDTLEQTASNKISPALISELHGVEELQKVFEVLSAHMDTKFLDDKNLYNIVNDLSKVMRSHPQYRYILRGLFEWQIFKIQSLATITYAQIVEESNKFSTKTGFSNELVFEVLIAIAKGLGNKTNNEESSQRFLRQNFPKTIKSINKVYNNVPSASTYSTANTSIKNNNLIVWDFIKDCTVKAVDEGIIKIFSTDSDEIKQIKNQIYIIPKWIDEAGLTFQNFELNKVANDFEITYKICVNKSFNHQYNRWISCHKYVSLLLFDTDGHFVGEERLGQNKLTQRDELWRGYKEVHFKHKKIGLILLLPGLFIDYKVCTKSPYNLTLLYNNSEIFNKISVDNSKNKEYKIEHPIAFTYKRSFGILLTIQELKRNKWTLSEELWVSLSMNDFEGDAIFYRRTRIWTEQFNYTKLKTIISFEFFDELPCDFCDVNNVSISIDD